MRASYYRWPLPSLVEGPCRALASPLVLMEAQLIKRRRSGAIVSTDQGLVWGLSSETR
jgi:hypothetical protein